MHGSPSGAGVNINVNESHFLVNAFRITVRR
jgi:hypothetical protein